MTLETRARTFARLAHAGVKRKYTGEPYVNHPIALVDTLRSVGVEDETMFAAALLHDVVEDTLFTIKSIETLFGNRVASLVADLTDVSVPADGNRAFRKNLDLVHTTSASPDAKTIKLADLLDNTKSILLHDKKFAKVYMKEKSSLLCVLTEGNPALFAEASRRVAEWELREMTK